MEPHRSFWLDWFGSFGRELGSPERWFTEDPEDLVKLVQRCAVEKKPCFMSVQPFKARNVVLGLEKLFYDFDSKTEPPILDKPWSEMLTLVERLKGELSIEPLIVATYRGYHVYVFLWQVVEFSFSQQAFARDLYATLQNMLLDGRPYATLDSHVLGDLKRMSRVPYTLHEKGVECTPVDLNGQPLQIDSLNRYRALGIQEGLFREAIKKVKDRETAREILEVFESFKSKPMVQKPYRRKWQIRPCFLEALKAGEMPHEMRMALVYEASCSGMSFDETVNLYRCLNDFNEEKTRYQVTWLLGHAQSVKPYRCKTMQKKGWCLGPSCPMFKQ